MSEQGCGHRAVLHRWPCERLREANGKRCVMARHLHRLAANSPRSPGRLPRSSGPSMGARQRARAFRSGGGSTWACPPSRRVPPLVPLSMAYGRRAGIQRAWQHGPDMVDPWPGKSRRSLFGAMLQAGDWGFGIAAHAALAGGALRAAGSDPAAPLVVPPNECRGRSRPCDSFS